ncbi:hypothetical protein [Methyloligella solikamskensis]|uniref:Apea-like HEPN domain-containing protein n=1 Tax=Methyloligella solikamskensis TaxID=1177756 RepID=A0ABW3JDG8_9HYPH
MATIISLIEEITIKISQLPGQGSIPQQEDGVLFPPILSTGDGGVIFINKEILHVIENLSHVLRENCSLLKYNATIEESNTLIRTALGRPLTKALSPEEIRQHIRETLKEAANPARHGQDYSFGCKLFENVDLPKISVGPVVFEQRTEWLTRKISESAISSISGRRIQRSWSGQRLKKRKPSQDSSSETSVINAISGAPYACSVVVQGLTPGMGRDRAVISSRIALVALALAWDTPATVLRGLNLTYDSTPFLRRYLVQFGPMLGSGSAWSELPYGPMLRAGQWAEMASTWHDKWLVIGTVLDWYLDPSSSSRPQVMRRLFHALLIFHEACREQLPLLATAKFAASLDALGLGRNENGIVELVRARLGVKSDEILFGNEIKASEAISKIFAAARSQTLHGNNREIARDWSDWRARAEQLSRLCLIRCLERCSSDPATDDPEKLFLG